MNRTMPLIIFFALLGVFSYRLLLIGEGNMPDLIPSVLINKPAPVFDLPPLTKNGKHFSNADLKGKVTLINFFASWCLYCRAEHPYWSALTDKKVVLVGIDYKNDPVEAVEWLDKLGNPYALVAVDREGHTGIDFGLYGVPESYLVDKQGIIRFKLAGPVTPDVIEQQLLPLIKELNQ
jgi:DsbE subfamily thiol:disulfide oxidoreductase